jgi:hypothetical protein
MKTERKHINLFEDKEIRCYKTVFNITNEEDLLQWWEYNIENCIDKYPNSIKFIHTLYRSCFHFVENHTTHFDIIFEKSAHKVYWTLWAQDEIYDINIDCTQFQGITSMKKDKRVSFQLSTQLEKASQPQVKTEILLNIKTAPVKLRVYNFLDEEDKLHLIELNEELNEELVYLEGKGFCQKSIVKIQQLLAQYSLTLSPYREIYHIKQSIDELAYFMSEHKEMLTELDKSYISLFEGLIVNLRRWFDALFIHGAGSIEAYKKSISADVEIIKAMTIHQEEEGEIEFF